MKFIVFIQIIVFSNLLFGQSTSRNDQLLIESSELIYEDIQEAQRLLSFVNHSNSSNDQIILSLLILADAAYLKGDYVEIMNNLYKAEDLIPQDDASMMNLVKLYETKYFRILGFSELSRNIFNNIQEKTVNNQYNLKSIFGLEKSYWTDDQKEKSDELKKALYELNTNLVFGHSLNNEIQIRLMETNAESDRNFHYLEQTSGNSYYKAKVDFLNGKKLRDIHLLEKADSFLRINPGVHLQLEVQKELAMLYSNSSQTELYKKQIQRTSELENLIHQSKVKARDLVVRHLENDRKVDHSKKNNIWMFFVAISIILSVLGLLYYLKTRRDYKRFLQVMNRINEKQESSRIQTIPEKTEQLLLKKLDKFEQSHRFIQNDISLTNLAKNLNTNTKYLSDVINRNKGVNFNQYINELRINYIIEKMKSEPKYLNYKIFYLAEECGFSSQSSFSTVFKSITGISPMSFVKFLKNENSN